MNSHSNIKFAQRFVCPFPRKRGKVGMHPQGVGRGCKADMSATTTLRVTCMAALIVELVNDRLAR